MLGPLCWSEDRLHNSVLQNTEIKIYSFYFNPLSLNIHIQILQTDLYIFP